MIIIITVLKIYLTYLLDLKLQFNSAFITQCASDVWSKSFSIIGQTIKRIAIYTPKDGKLIMNCSGCVATRWPGGQVPAARRVFRYVLSILLGSIESLNCQIIILNSPNFLLNYVSE